MEFTNVNLNQSFAKQNRRFSSALKQKIVDDIDAKRISIKDVVSLYSVTRTSIYKWIYAYSKKYIKGTKMVVELESEAEKVKELMRRNAELERAYGLKQLENDYLNKMLEFGSGIAGFDIKKVRHTTIEYFRLNKNSGNYTMESVFIVAGISKQAHNSYMSRQSEVIDISSFIYSFISEIREIHPRMGLKKIFTLCQPDIIGRDKFIEQGVNLGLSLPKERNFQRTTYSSKRLTIKNIASEKEIFDINKIWSSDITYFNIDSVFYYITFLMDVYSRFIVGYTASSDMRAESTIKALTVALKTRKGADLSDLIHHSDRGSQYGSELYLERLDDNKIRPSMCDSVYENTHIERVNGIMKNEYLVHRKICNLKDLCKYLKKDVHSYNYERPHWSIGAISLAEYERNLLTIPLTERTPMQLFKEQKVNYNSQQEEIF